MSFLRASDTVAYDPRTLYPLEDPDADERTVDEVFGFSVRLAAECGSKETDRVARRSQALQLAGSKERLDRLMGYLVAAKVWLPLGEGGWELINDTGYLHLRAQDDIERDRIRQRDARDDALTVPARLRDGDHCRYCKAEVNWGDRKSLRGATWEHVNIANQPTQLDEYVVACFGCNREPSSRGELLPPPVNPRYGAATKDFIKKRLGKFPTRSEMDAKYPGLRTRTGNAVDNLRPDEESAVDDLRPSSESAVGDLRPVLEHAATTTTPEPERPPQGRSGPIQYGSLDPGSDGSRSAGSGNNGSSTKPVNTQGASPRSAVPAKPANRSRRAKPQPQEKP